MYRKGAGKVDADVGVCAVCRDTFGIFHINTTEPHSNPRRETLFLLFQRGLSEHVPVHITSKWQRQISNIRCSLSKLNGVAWCCTLSLS